MLLTEWSAHSDAIEQAREDGDSALLFDALARAFRVGSTEAEVFVGELVKTFESRGHAGGGSLNNAIEIVLDAHLTEKQEFRQSEFGFRSGEQEVRHAESRTGPRKEA